MKFNHFKKKVLLPALAVIGIIFLGGLYIRHNQINQVPLEKVYSIATNPDDGEKGMKETNDALWKLANNVFVKNVKYGSTPDEVHEVLGQPKYVTTSSKVSAAMMEQDEEGADNEVNDSGLPRYPDKYKWDMKALPKNKAKPSNVEAETYAIKVKFQTGRTETRYWHIYYFKGRATLQSYTMSIQNLDGWKEFLDTKYERP